VSESAPPLLPIFRSAAQLRVLAELFTGRAPELSVGDLARRTGVPQATVSREVARLAAAGLVEDREVGRSRLVRARAASPVHGELTALLTKVAGPPAVLGDLLRGVPGVREGYIYGSWARRWHGEPGDEPADIDVLVVSDAGPDAVRAARTAADAAGERLGRDVTVTVLDPREWAEGISGFLTAVRGSPRVALDLG
jgi:DNA-binding transcriptional ArsR family regulator